MDLIELEKQLHQYQVRTDITKLNGLLDPEFQEVGVSGDSFNFDSIIQLLSEEKDDGSFIHAQDFSSVQLSNTAILLLYRSVNVSAQGKYKYYAKRTSIWVKNQSGWQMKYHQGTPCADFEIKGETPLVSDW